MSNRKFIFVGVSTGQSSIMQIFPRWRARLGLGEDVAIEGCDLPLHAPAEQYRHVVLRVRDDPETLGAVVTTHKMDLYAAAHDLFDWLDGSSRLLGEVSTLAMRGDKLCGWSRDSMSAGRALEGILANDHFARTGSEVLCFGAGGAGHAVALCLLTRREDPPRRIVMTDQDPRRLESVQNIRRNVGSPVELLAVHTDDPHEHDDLMTALPAGSLVVNATGMGKDLPGSPVTDEGQFPLGGIAWDLNYRGERRFLQQASAQARARGVRLADGWTLFISGWAAGVEDVFDKVISTEELEQLAADALVARNGN